MTHTKDSRPYWLVLILVSVLIIGGIFAILLIKQPGLSPAILGQIRTTGSYNIEAPQQMSVNSPFQVKFIADSHNQNVNAVSLNVTYDPTKITILGIDTSQSFCQFYPENKFNNDRGMITISCGAPHPGFKGKNIIAIVNFYTKNIGNTDITVTSKSQILLNDGKGTNIFSEPVSHPLLIINNI